MTPNSKDAMTPSPAKRRITRSATFKLGLAEFSSVGFFSSHGTTCDPSQAAEMSEELYRDAYDDVERAVREYKSRMGDHAAVAEEVLHPERTQAPEVSPFRVTAAPIVTEPANMAAAPAGVTGMSAPEIQVRRDEDKGLTEKSTPESAAPARRGRPPKAQQNSGIDATTTAERSGTLQSPSGEADNAAPAVKSPDQFRADDSDLPKEIGGTSEVPPGPDLKAKHEAIRASEAAKAAGPQLVPPAKPVLSQVERLAAIETALAKDGKRTPESIHSALGIFMKAFLNTPEKLKKPPMPEYEPIVPIMERIVETNPGVLMADPAKAGLEAGVGWNKLLRHTDKWRDELKTTAMDLAVYKYPEDCFDLLDFLHTQAKLDNLDKELYTFMRVMRATNAAIAMALRAAGTEQNKSMAEIMDGLDFETATEGDILARISGASKPEPAKTESLWQEQLDSARNQS